MDGRARPGQIDSQRMASGAGGGWIGSSYQAGSQFSMYVPSLCRLSLCSIASDLAHVFIARQERPLDLLAA